MLSTPRFRAAFLATFVIAGQAAAQEPDDPNDLQGAPPPGPASGDDDIPAEEDGALDRLVYARLGGGIAGFDDSVTADGQPDATVGGVAVAFEVALGASPLSGLAIALGFWGGHAPSPGLDIDGTEAPTSPDPATLGIVGLHADYFFRPDGGFHAQALLGYGLLLGGTDDADAPRGLGLGIGGGYEWALAPGLGVGLLGRVTYSPMGTSSGGVDQSHTVTLPALLLTGTYY